MNIVEDKLEGVPFESTPNMGGALQPTLLVIHYTVTNSKASPVRLFKTPRGKLSVSAHLVVDRDGSVTQVVPFNRVAWHAGPSQWRGRSGCNDFAIGIEVVNVGPLVLRNGVAYDDNQLKYDGERIEALHKNGSKFKLWATYTEQQVAVLDEIGQALVQKYPIREVVGHDDIAPGRKIDPGPAFPMASYAGRLFGRDQNSAEEFEATEELNVRGGPAVSFIPVPGSPLKAGERVRFIDRDGLWWHIKSVGSPTEGWVHSRFLAQVL